jgi:hypothetical protein
MLLDQRTIIIDYVPKGNRKNFVSTLITYKMYQKFIYLQ